jgi:small basic protein
VYQGHLPIAGLPGTAVATMKEGLSQGLAVARLAGSPALVRGVRAAFVQGMDAAFLVSAGIAAIGLLLTLVFMPLRTGLQAVTPDASAAGSSPAPDWRDAENAATGPNPLATGRIVTATAEQVE